MVLSKSWLLLALPLAVVALVLLTLTAVSLLRTVRSSVVMSVPVRAEQAVTFKEAGSYVLNVEGKTFSRAAAGLGFVIATEGSATSVPLQKVLMRTEVSSFSRTRLELYSFEIAAPGVYTLRITGTNSSSGNDNAAIVFTKPFTLALVLHVLALVALGVMLIGSLVVTGLVLAKRPLVTGSESNLSGQSTPGAI